MGVGDGAGIVFALVGFVVVAEHGPDKFEFGIHLVAAVQCFLDIFAAKAGLGLLQFVEGGIVEAVLFGQHAGDFVGEVLHA